MFSLLFIHMGKELTKILVVWELSKQVNILLYYSVIFGFLVLDFIFTRYNDLTFLCLFSFLLDQKERKNHVLEKKR